jgi:hypothetical protein
VRERKGKRYKSRGRRENPKGKRKVKGRE